MQDEAAIALANQPMEKRLMRYIWRNTRPEQVWILSVILVSMVPYFLALELPVRIVNQGIQGIGFDEAGATLPFLALSIPVPGFLGGGSFDLFEGFRLERLEYLYALSCAFLALVCVNGLFKFYINTYKGRLGERMLRRMRYALTDRVLRFPISHFKRVKGSEVASMVKDEVEPFGEFIGDAFVQPVYLGGQALVAFVFIMTQSAWLGLIAISIIIVQVMLIPRLRRRLLELGRQRQLTARLLSGRIGEIVEGITAVHANDTSNYERAEIADRLGKIFFIRYELYQRKFFIKFLNNFLAQLTPFLFYVVGGYFAIRGSLNVGQLLGVINAYKDLPTPINGLIMWDQKRVDIDVKYAQIVEQFNVRGLMPAEQQWPSEEAVEPLEGEIHVANLSVTDDTGHALVEDADFRMDVRDRIAVLGPLGSGAGATANVLAGLAEPTGGRITLSGRNMADLPQRVRGRRFAYAGSESYLPQAPLIDCLLYATKHMPLRAGDPPEDRHARHEIEARAAGNTLLDFHHDWVDYEAMGLSGPDDVFDAVRATLELVELDDVVRQLALRQRLDADEHPDTTATILDMRRRFREAIEGTRLEGVVDTWEWEEFNAHATIAENLLYGAPRDPDALSARQLARDADVRRVLAEEGLDRAFFDMGVELAETAIELFADLSPDNPFFEQLNFMTPEQLEAYPPILARAREKGFEGTDETDRRMLIQLPFGYEEKRNRLKLVDDALEARVVAARHKLHADLPETLAQAISVYNVDAYNSAESVRDNILFGRVAHGAAAQVDELDRLVDQLIREGGLEDDIFRIGLRFDVGTGGRRLSEAQRQKVILARALLKGADLLIVNRGLNSLDQRSQGRLVKRVLERARGGDGEGNGRGFGVFWVLTTPSFADRFERVMVFERQRLVEDGAPDALADTSETFQALVA